MILHKEHRVDDDVATGDVGLATGQLVGIASPFGRRMNGQAESRHRLSQTRLGTRTGTHHV